MRLATKSDSRIFDDVFVFAAVFSISSNLALTMNQAKPEIAVLKTMGASNRDILIIFLLTGLHWSFGRFSWACAGFWNHNCVVATFQFS